MQGGMSGGAGRLKVLRVGDDPWHMVGFSLPYLSEQEERPLGESTGEGRKPASKKAG